MSERTITDPWKRRVDSGDWDAIRAELDSLGGALLPQLLTPSEAEELCGLYGQPARFRSTINMGRHRFGEGEYRYFARPCPEPVERLKQALYPRLLPIARDWWARLGRPAPWPDTLDEWLRMCHDAWKGRQPGHPGHRGGGSEGQGEPLPDRGRRLVGRCGPDRLIEDLYLDVAGVAGVGHGGGDRREVDVAVADVAAA
jgi:Oxygenase, catalysing oxidative methylation of damaged DNA